MIQNVKASQSRSLSQPDLKKKVNYISNKSLLPYASLSFFFRFEETDDQNTYYIVKLFTCIRFAFKVIHECGAAIKIIIFCCFCLFVFCFLFILLATKGMCIIMTGLTVCRLILEFEVLFRE